MARIDETGDLITIAPDGLVKLDGVTILRKVERDGTIYAQFYDRDRMRSQMRKTPLIEIPLVILTSILEGKSADAQVIHSPME